MTRYLIADGWTHIFTEDGRDRERPTRFVFDRESRSLPVLDIQRENKWRAGTEVEKADLLDSLVDANAEALDAPADWDLVESDSIPAWN
jgi:hypothetical protein